MDHYIEITLRPDAEMPLNWLLNAVYTKLHKTLHDLDSTSIGVSFPQYKVILGNTLRIHGRHEALDKLMQQNWLGGMLGYCKLSGITPVPGGVNHRIISRKQSTMTPSKLRRLIERGSISDEEAKQYRANMFRKGLDNPYIELQSTSNGHRHRRYIEFGQLLDHPISGEYDSFGLSKTATVPWF